MSGLVVVLRPLTRADLAAITPWFEDPDTRRYLGGPDWPVATRRTDVTSVRMPGVWPKQEPGSG